MIANLDDTGRRSRRPGTNLGRLELCLLVAFDALVTERASAARRSSARRVSSVVRTGLAALERPGNELAVGLFRRIGREP